MMRKSFNLSVLVFLAGLAISGAARADTLPAPRASYDAEVTLYAGSNHYTSTVNAAGPNERRTVNLPNGPQTVIVQRTTGKIYLLIPQMNAAMPLDPTTMKGFDISQIDRLPATAEAREAIEGNDTTRYAVSGQTGQGSFNGHVWATPDGIIMKIEGQTEHNGKTAPVKVVLTNLHRRPQDPRLFALPAGTKVMPEGLGALMKGFKNTPVSGQ